MIRLQFNTIAEAQSSLLALQRLGIEAGCISAEFSSDNSSAVELAASESPVATTPVANVPQVPRVDDVYQVLKDNVSIIVKMIEEDANVAEIAAKVGVKPRIVGNYIATTLGFKKVFGEWKQFKPREKEVSVPAKIASLALKIKKLLAGNYRINQIAKQFDLPPDALEDYVNNKLHLFWFEKDRMWRHKE